MKCVSRNRTLQKGRFLHPGILLIGLGSQAPTGSFPSSIPGLRLGSDAPGVIVSEHLIVYRAEDGQNRRMRSEEVMTTAAPRSGAQASSQGVTYRVWAPDHKEGAVCIQSPDAGERRLDLRPQEGGFFEAVDESGKAGDLYSFEFMPGKRLPDPCSRFQPQGVHGPSECIDPSTYVWQNERWPRPRWHGQSIYEMHIGTFTEDGTFRSAIARLDHLVELGVEAIEIMPIADFAGDRNWGYDGVALYAPARCYGRPDDFRALVDAAHQRGLAVILDVVYNHLGPSGNYLGEFAQAYFHPTRSTPWGSAFNLDTPANRPVRELFVENAAYWLDEFRIDGLRLDATHAIEDQSERHLLAEIAEAVHARGGFVISEDERNSSELLAFGDGRGHGIDAVWSDDFHHQVRVALTGIRESYFGSYAGTTDELALTLSRGWFYTGQPFPFWSGRQRGGECTHLPPSAFVYCIENHDQVGNRALGERLEHLVEPALFRAATMLLCLSPYSPLLFMGQEWAASSPFLFFTDHEGELGRAVSAGRRKEFAAAEMNRGIRAEDIPDPQDLLTFVRSKLDWREVAEFPHRQTFALYRECLRVRKQYVLPFTTTRTLWSVTVVDAALVIRYAPPEGPAMLLVVALQPGSIDIAAQSPAIAPPEGRRWRAEVQTEDPHFGGTGKIGGAAMHATTDVSPWLNFERPGAVFFVEEGA